MSRELRRALIELRDARMQAASLQGKSDISRDWVFPSPDGSILDPDNLYHRYFVPVLAKSGVRKIRLHDLRHTFASYLVMKGVDIRTVQTLMGHRSIVMTMRYSHLSATHLQKAIASLEGSASRTNQEQRGPEEKALAP